MGGTWPAGHAFDIRSATSSNPIAGKSLGLVLLTHRTDEEHHLFPPGYREAQGSPRRLHLQGG